MKKDTKYIMNNRILENIVIAVTFALGWALITSLYFVMVTTNIRIDSEKLNHINQEEVNYEFHSETEISKIKDIKSQWNKVIHTYLWNLTLNNSGAVLVNNIEYIQVNWDMYIESNMELVNLKVIPTIIISGNLYINENVTEIIWKIGVNWNIYTWKSDNLLNVNGSMWAWGNIFFDRKVK